MDEYASNQVRDRLAIALDMPELVQARRVAGLVSRHFGVAKIGLELFTSAGPRAVEALRAEGMAVFLDLKLHDIPTTVGRTAEVLGRLGIRYTTMHSAGGAEMLRAGISGLKRGAREMGHPEPMPLAVTVLTSDEPDPGLLDSRLRAVMEAECPGVVCAATDLNQIRDANLFAVTPGIRPTGGELQDQKRVSTPRQALAAGSDLLVIGRPITAALDPVRAAEEISQDAADGLASWNRMARSGQADASP